MSKALIAGLPLLGLAACTTETAPGVPVVGAPNPAAAYCVAQGGTSEIRAEAGGEVGYCRLPDGRVVGEWAFFRARTQAQ